MRLRRHLGRYQASPISTADHKGMGDITERMLAIARAPTEFGAPATLKRPRGDDSQAYDLSTPDAPAGFTPKPLLTNTKKTVKALVDYLTALSLRTPKIDSMTLSTALLNLPTIVRGAYPGAEVFRVSEEHAYMRRFRAVVEGNAMDVAVYRAERDRIFSEMRQVAPIVILATALNVLLGVEASNMSAPIRLATGTGDDDGLSEPDLDRAFPPVFAGEMDFSMFGSNMALLADHAMSRVVALFVSSPNVHAALQRLYGAGVADVVTGVHQHGSRTITVYFQRTNSGDRVPVALVVPGVGRLSVNTHELLIGARATLDGGYHTTTVPLSVDSGLDNDADTAPANQIVASGVYMPRVKSATIRELVSNMARTVYELFRVEDEPYNGWRARVQCRDLGLSAADCQRAINAVTGADAPTIASFEAEWEQTATTPGAGAEFLTSHGVPAYVAAVRDVNRPLDFFILDGTADADVANMVADKIRRDYRNQRALYGLAGHPFSDAAIQLAADIGVHPFVNVVMFARARLRTTPITTMPPASVVIAYTPPADQDRQDTTMSYLVKPVVTSNCAVIIGNGVEVYPNGGMHSLQSVADEEWEWVVLPASWLAPAPDTGRPLADILRAPAAMRPRAGAGLLASRVVGAPQPNGYGGRLHAMDNTNIDVLRQAFAETMN